MCAPSPLGRAQRSRRAREASAPETALTLGALVCAAWVAGCVGTALPANEQPGAGGGGTGEPTAQVPQLPRTPPPAALKRLTASEYRSAVGDLLGGVDIPAADLPEDTPLYGFTSIGAALSSISPRDFELYEAAALKAAAASVGPAATAATREARLGCAPAALTDPCVRTFLARFGRKAWRRPLTTAEVDRSLRLATTAQTQLGSVWSGLQFAVAGLLTSPHFLYRVELGEPDPALPARRSYSGYEMASRLAFVLSGTTPDDALLDSAESGALATAEGVRAAATALLSAPRARPAVMRYFTQQLRLEELSALPKSAALFPRWTPSLAAAMRQEVETTTADLIFDRDADFRELLTSRRTFVNAELAALYGLPAPAGSGFVAADLPADGERAGLLGMAGVLSMFAHSARTSPTLRGKFVRTHLLCEEIPPPPQGVVTTLPSITPDMTTRQVVEQHAGAAACFGCHARMDPIGVGFEGFDSVGAARATENGVAVDTSGTLDNTPYRGLAELGKLLHDDPRVAPCLVRELYTFATAHVPEDSEQLLQAELAVSFAGSGHRFRGLLVELMASDAFRFASAPQ